jgi:hypothetical protein
MSIKKLLPPSPPSNRALVAATPPSSPPPESPVSPSLNTHTQRLLDRVRACFNGSNTPGRYAVHLAGKQYTALQRAIAADKELTRWAGDNLRYDWTPAVKTNGGAGEFVLRMPLPKHDVFAQALQNRIQRAIRELIASSTLSDHSKRLAQAIVSQGTSDIKVGQGKKSPDASFAFKNHPQPLVILEVAYSESIQDLKKKAKEYIRNNCNVVVAVDLEYQTPGQRSQTDLPLPPTAAYSVYRVQRYEENGKQKKTLQTVAEDVDFIHHRTGELQLRLGDFFPKEHAQDDAAELPIHIPHTELDAMLLEANARQQIFDDNTGQSSDSEWVEPPEQKSMVETSFESQASYVPSCDDEEEPRKRHKQHATVHVVTRTRSEQRHEMEGDGGS